MNVHAFPSTAKGFGAASFEVLKALGRGLLRAVAYAGCCTNEVPYAQPTENPELDYLQLCSAVEHLTRTPPVLRSLFYSERYIDRIERASPTLLAKVLAEFGCTEADISVWRAFYDDQPPAVAH